MNVNGTPLETAAAVLEHAGVRLPSPKPIRVQLSRKAGWRMPANTVKVTRPGKWGNPFRVGFGEIETTAEAVSHFREVHEARDMVWIRAEIRKTLRGKNLACWCKPGAPCHADVLLEIANAPDSLPECPKEKSIGS